MWHKSTALEVYFKRPHHRNFQINMNFTTVWVFIKLSKTSSENRSKCEWNPSVVGYNEIESFKLRRN